MKNSLTKKEKNISEIKIFENNYVINLFNDDF